MAIGGVMAGGGTGGHVFPALALADTIREREPRAQVQFIGTERGIEKRLIPSAGYPLDFIAARPVLGKGPIDLARAALDAVRGFFRARRLLRAARADLVIGLGAYASFPTVAAAASRGLPIGLLQMDAQPGLANRILGRFARGVFVQFAETARRFAPGRARITGIPVRRLPGPAARGDSDAEPEEGLLRLLIFGGSQGARSLNRAVLASLSSLDSRDGFRITHQTGSAELAAVRDGWVGAPASEYLFLSHHGDRPASRYLTSLVREYVKASGVKKQGSCHLFRHTVATLMLENGADIRAIQELLGHRSLETTQIYTQVSILRLKAVHGATHPVTRELLRPLKKVDGVDEPAVTEQELRQELLSEQNAELVGG